MCTSEGRRIIAEACCSSQQPDWDVHVDEHCQRLQDFLVNVMEENFAITGGSQRATYIPDWVWSLRDSKMRLKRRTTDRVSLWKKALGAAFNRWASPEEGSSPPIGAKDSILYQLTASAIAVTTMKIMQGIRHAKAEYLRALVTSGTTAPSQILRQAKKAGVGGRKARPVVWPPPLLLKADGTAATSRPNETKSGLHSLENKNVARL